MEQQGTESADLNELAVLVRQRRKQLGLSLRAAAAEASVPFTTLSRVENGHLPDLATFRSIVNWLGLPPENFFTPVLRRQESTPDVIARHLRTDPNLTPAASEKLAGLVREMYSSLIRPPEVAVHLRAHTTFTPQAGAQLGSILTRMQARLLEEPAD